MRPLELRVTGLRSYQTETTIPFTGIDLLAIVGPTGSGKSSILEAITYALYGTATWGGRDTKALISDGALRMSVSLSFEADGQQWLITRSTPSGSYPPGTQELICTSDPTQPKIDGSAEVRARVVELIGLDYEGFKSCVLLPQGRFDQLLRATAAVRVGILKGILGLESLDDMCTRARALERLVQDRLDEITSRRQQFLPDPQQTLDQAQARIGLLQPRLAELTALQKQVDALVEEVREHLARCKEAGDAADRLSELIDKDLLAELKRLATVEAELAAEHAVAAEAAATAERRATEANDEVQTARSSRTMSGDVGEARAVVAATASELNALATDGTALADRIAELAAEKANLERAEGDCEQLAAKVADLVASAEAADAAVANARGSSATIHALIESLVAAREERAAAEREVQAALTAQEQAQIGQGDAESAHALAEADIAQAEAKLEAAQLADAVAEVAHHCRPGDSCPVCTRPLPDDFVPPRPTADVVALKQAASAARARGRDTGDKLSQARAATQAASERVASAHARHAAAREIWERLDATSLPGGLKAETVSADSETNALVDAPVVAAEAAVHIARDAWNSATVEHQQAVATCRARRAAAEQRAQEIGAERDRLAAREHAVREKLRALPHWIEISETPTGDELSEVHEGLASVLEAAEEREERGRAASASLAAAQSDLRAINERVQHEVKLPASSAVHRLTSLMTEANRHLADPYTAPALEAAVSELIPWAEEVAAAAGRVLAERRKSSQDEADTANAKQAKGLELLQNAGFEKSTDLRDAVSDVGGDIRYANAERNRARPQLEAVATLDALVVQAEQLRASLRELVYQLGDGQFVKFVVENRQRTLLRLASGIFRDVTSGQYGFSEDFRVVDRHTGAARTPDTLSGGEKFLASLALALGLVELAGRSGGRLQALFLDEGFGSLDPDALVVALDELEHRAQAGRLIAMISHVPAIAERIDNVMRVEKTPQGSRVSLLTEDERLQLLLDDATEAVAEVQ